jgi:hypothetical protein
MAMLTEDREENRLRKKSSSENIPRRARSPFHYISTVARHFCTQTTTDVCVYVTLNSIGRAGWCVLV